MQNIVAEVDISNDTALKEFKEALVSISSVCIQGLPMQLSYFSKGEGLALIYIYSCFFVSLENRSIADSSGIYCTCIFCSPYFS